MAVFTQYLNIALFVIIIAYLVIQCYRDIKEILKDLKDDNETFED